MKKIKLIEKIEGEATLKFSYKDNLIDFVDIEFFNTRNIENILQNKPALDALVINPRVCGICGHAHLQATAKALEDCIDGLVLSNKAKIIRELSLNFEIIQNHFKWFYMTIMPLLGYKDAYIKALYPFQTINKAIATIAGQYPHNSYAIVGGIVSEVTTMDLVRLKSLIDEVVEFFEKEVVQNSIENIQECDNVDLLLSREGDLSKILHHLKNQNLDNIGKSYDRFIVFGSSSYFESGKSNKTRVTKRLDTKYIKALYPSQIINKAIATIAGQYPHNSYAIVGGIVSEVTTMDLVRLKSLIDEVVEFFEKEVLQSSIANLQECDNVDFLLSRDGDVRKVLHHL
jgi:hydrogenase large subunit